MKASQFFISTLKEAPAEAALPSHKLMLRAGLIKANASGLYTWMPMGLRVLRKVENIVREENEPRRRHRTFDARHPAGRLVERVRPLGFLRRRTFADYRPPRQRILLQPHLRRDGHRHCPQRNQFLQTTAEKFLPHQHQIPRRTPPPLRRDARARICDERRLFVPRRFRLAAGNVSGDV